MVDSRVTKALAAIAAIAVGALVLAGCAGGESANDAESSVESSPASASDTASPTESASATESETPAGGEDVAPTAIATAVGSLPGSRAFAYARDEQDRYIEVTVIDAESVKRVVILNISGTGVAGTQDAGRLDSSDLADFNAATVEMVDAIGTAQASTPGVLRDADLEDPDQMIVWEIEIHDGANTTTVQVDAESGTITS